MNGIAKVAHSSCTSGESTQKQRHGGSQFPEIPKAPFHPDINAKFKARSFGKTNVVLRSSQPSWCSKWPWLHYSEAKDLAFCHVCIVGLKENKLKTLNWDAAFVS